ncbi:uncharacterized protein EV422DRAFT_598628 [Fimicolochytrium jonesii]|uniref:uncharacterized protein n=1 Tax=Fimicolochytrium jonesii TaxID=1396493 RepID=UPI0022FF1E9D|nr:uncharacterized protein EV422DRAFT_598628 [Fimicolochytrium jonesii]KAI8819308.1 hypothetical protein EV422DRAFT_598628 [Fimicolochytrium jonesii]
MTNIPPRFRSQELSTLWSEAALLEASLKNSERRKRQKLHPPQETGPLDAEGRTLRLSLLQIYEDLIILDPILAWSKGVDDKIWNLVFHSAIHQLRSAANGDLTSQAAISRELQLYIKSGISFYQVLILWLKSALKKDPVEMAISRYTNSAEEERLEPEDTLFTSLCGLIHKCLVSLGDLSRYLEMHSSTPDKNWKAANGYYTTAIKVNPDVGKPYAQLAISATYENKNMAAVYWYCLSLVNKQRHSVTRENLTVFYKSFMSLGGPSKVDVSPTGTLTANFLNLHRLIFCHDDVPIEELFHLYGKISLDINDPALATNVYLARWLQMAVPISIATYEDLNHRFVEEEDTSVRRALRSRQVYVAGTGCTLMKLSLDNLSTYLSDKEDMAEAFADVDDDHIFSKFLAPAAVTSVWLQTQLEVFTQFASYVKTIENGRTALETSLMDMLYSLATFTNMVSSFAEMDGCSDALPEDVELLGLPPLRPFYRKLNPKSLESVVAGENLCLSVSDTQIAAEQNVDDVRLTARVARIAQFAKKLAEDDRVDLFRFDEAEGMFFVADQQSKKRGMHKLMQALATERLKHQVTTLEENLNEMKQTSLPVVIFDTGVYVQLTNAVKRWVTGGKCVVVVPRSVIDNLDYLKKGADKENARAREAIRFLEQRFRYRSPFLRSQQEHEQIVPWNVKTGYIETRAKRGMVVDQDAPKGVFIPKTARGLMACLHWYHSNVALPDTSAQHENEADSDLSFVFVTEDPEMARLSQALGIRTKSLTDWEQTMMNRNIRRRQGAFTRL